LKLEKFQDKPLNGLIFGAGGLFSENLNRGKGGERGEKKKRKKKRTKREKREERRGKVQVDLHKIPIANRELGTVSGGLRFACIWRGWQTLMKVFCPKIELCGLINLLLAGHTSNYASGA